ncbi:hypothetical protein [Muriicola sp. Z0-33]|uniref:hypothetical protein n=1 Tax=Muriicola sp. Z0-33 TaxID=2816957 RepID=UPI00223733F0|nr:hypothetical protein [Muriicola sp. Z0-33]MCW5517882.1 hypothetical protein [Muriicola sp. Z0-33]
MKINIRITLLLVGISSLLMAVLCEKQELGPVLERNSFKVTLSEGPVFLQTDTLWINGKVSSMLANKTTGDSIMNSNDFVRDIISVLRLKTADGNSNTVEATNEFIFVTRLGNTDFLGVCPDSELIAQAPLAQNGQQYEYQIGLVGENSGDFVLSWLEPVTLQNGNLNIQILDKYPVNNKNNYLQLTKCGIGYSIEDVRQRKREFFFSVE